MFTGHDLMMRQLSKILEPLNDNGIFVGVEVGVWEGELSERLLMHYENLLLHMVDPWDAIFNSKRNPREPTRWKNRPHGLMGKHKASTRTKPYLKRRWLHSATSLQAAKIFRGFTQFDFVIIDADHDYDSVLADMNAWWPLVCRGGFLICNEYGKKGVHADVTKAVDYFSKYQGPFERLGKQLAVFKKQE